MCTNRHGLWWDLYQLDRVSREEIEQVPVGTCLSIQMRSIFVDHERYASVHDLWNAREHLKVDPRLGQLLIDLSFIKRILDCRYRYIIIFTELPALYTDEVEKFLRGLGVTHSGIRSALTESECEKRPYHPHFWPLGGYCSGRTPVRTSLERALDRFSDQVKGDAVPLVARLVNDCDHALFIRPEDGVNLSQLEYILQVNGVPYGALQVKPVMRLW